MRVRVAALKLSFQAYASIRAHFGALTARPHSFEMVVIRRRVHVSTHRRRTVETGEAATAGAGAAAAAAGAEAATAGADALTAVVGGIAAAKAGDPQALGGSTTEAAAGRGMAAMAGEVKAFTAAVAAAAEGATDTAKAGGASPHAAKAGGGSPHTAKAGGGSPSAAAAGGELVAAAAGGGITAAAGALAVKAGGGCLAAEADDGGSVLTAAAGGSGGSVAAEAGEVGDEGGHGRPYDVPASVLLQLQQHAEGGPNEMEPAMRKRLLMACARAREREGVPPAVLAKWAECRNDRTGQYTSGFLLEWCRDQTFGQMVLHERHQKVTSRMEGDEVEWLSEADVYVRYAPLGDGGAHARGLLAKARSRANPIKGGPRLFRVCGRVVERKTEEDRIEGTLAAEHVRSAMARSLKRLGSDTSDLPKGKRQLAIRDVTATAGAPAASAGPSAASAGGAATAGAGSLAAKAGEALERAARRRQQVQRQKLSGLIFERRELMLEMQSVGIERGHGLEEARETTPKL
ncbi:MAG: hypothetical protein GY772_14265, partial [bacterium]|nr:hypothetical protein [bacterium]